MTYNEMLKKYNDFLDGFYCYVHLVIEEKIKKYRTAKEFAKAYGLTEVTLSRLRNNTKLVSEDIIAKICGNDIFDTDIPNTWKEIRISVLEAELQRLKEDTKENITKVTVNNWKKYQPCKEIVREWRKLNPEGRKIQCHYDTRLGRSTIDRYWDIVLKEDSDGCMAEDNIGGHEKS